MDLWYFWKAQNSKVFSNIDVDPTYTLKLAETESHVWAKAQESITQRVTQSRSMEDVGLPNILGCWCFTYGSWKDKDLFTSHAWYNTLEGFDGLMGARNVRASLTQLHLEIEALIWTMEFTSISCTFATDCSQLVKMV